MTYNVILTKECEGELRSLAKKYHSFKTDISALIGKLKENPYIGQKIGNNCYKIRLAIGSKNKGKSGGARIITHLIINTEDSKVFILSMYDKSEQDSISKDQIQHLISRIK